jgi:hypothetical protein
MMSSQAATVDSLIKKGKFEPQVAMAIAEAIDNAMSDSQLVTVPILDARFADHRAEIRGDLMRVENKIESVHDELDRKIESVHTGLDRKIDSVHAELDRKIDSVSAALDRKIDSVSAALDKKIDSVSAALDKKIDSVSAALDKKIDAVRMDIDKKIEVSFATLAGKMDVSVARLGELNERTKAELVRWVFVTMAGSLVGTVVTLFNALQHH